MLSSALLKRNSTLLRQAVGIINKIPHKFATILTIVNNSAVQPNLENYRHHFSLYLKIKYIVVISILFFSDDVSFQNFTHQSPDIWIKNNHNKNMNSPDLIRINNQHRSR